MARKLVKYCLVDTFTETAFKGNPSSVCLLEEEKDVEWLQNVAREFNQAVTSYLTELRTDHFASDQAVNGAATAKFHLRWFTRDGDEISICGHATLAASHFLLAHVLPNCDTVELSTLSGILIARRIPEATIPESFFTELNFPVLPLVEYDASEISTVSKILLNGAPVLEIKKTTVENYLFVVLPSGEAVKEVEPQFDAIRKYPARGIIITGPAPSGSSFDFYIRFFCPNLGAKFMMVDLCTFLRQLSKFLGTFSLHPFLKFRIMSVEALTVP
ncbi:hypothetical protein Pfo_006278 [Paulownia fortunei]|nr:hypothetical protein Pfo_006278 [Paulownia fortunei]